MCLCRAKQRRSFGLHRERCPSGWLVSAGGFPDQALRKPGALGTFSVTSKAGEIGHFAKAICEFSITRSDLGIGSVSCQSLQLGSARTVICWSEHHATRYMRPRSYVIAAFGGVLSVCDTVRMSLWITGRLSNERFRISLCLRRLCAFYALQHPHPLIRDTEPSSFMLCNPRVVSHSLSVGGVAPIFFGSGHLHTLTEQRLD